MDGGTAGGSAGRRGLGGLGAIRAMADAVRQAQVIAQQYFANPDDTVGKEYDGCLHCITTARSKNHCAKPRNRIIGNGFIVNGPTHSPNWGTAMILVPSS